MSPESPIQRVLIYRLGSLGDTVVALPCFHLLARTFPQAERFLLTNFPVHAKAPASAAVLGDSGLVHGYMRYTVGTRRVDELLRLAWEIRRFRADLLVYLMPMRPAKHVRRDRIFFSMAGVRRVVHVSIANPAADSALPYYSGKARVEQALAESGLDRRETVSRLYLLVLSRLPTPDELAAARAYGQSGKVSAADGVLDLAWALVNSPEFLYRH